MYKYCMYKYVFIYIFYIYINMSLYIYILNSQNVSVVQCKVWQCHFNSPFSV